MNKVFFSAVLPFFLSAPALADDPSIGILVAIPVDASYVPNGFDDNDDVVVVLDGHLPNNCYKVSHTEVLKDPVTNQVNVIQYARKYPGLCMQALVPFFSEAFLGVLPVGEFKIASPGAALEKLKVDEATSAGPDEFLYAPVDSIKINYDEVSDVYSGILDGRFTNSCMKIKEVVVADSGKTVEVLPKMELVQSPDGCVDTEVPFSWVVTLPKSMVKGRHLLHVRSLNGKAVNHMFSVY